ncbi:acetoin dehydrogenase dihydrolipoyllysine-residue acetyltransferase subunit [Dongia sp.]|uniref:acetoin dehydrogenase dihydrolipoyllysine-residue acetyltransferase subunit n=1 Tax=Dongia sp. TaxID=1977262 RepID=UPI0035B43464
MSASIQPINMPKWGMSMSEGKLVKWLVNEGEAIKPGQEIMEVETDKITNVVEAQDAGILRRKVAAEDETLPVGALLAVLADASIPDAEVDQFVDANRVVAVDGDGEVSLMSKIQVDGKTINVMDSGGDSNVAFLLIHGFGGDLNNWLFNFEELSKHLRTIAIDLPGHGHSSKDVGDGAAANLIAAVDGVIDALGLKLVHFVGHSMGGLIAALTAVSRPAVVGSLTLVAPAGLAAPVNSAYLGSFIAADDRKEMKRVLSDLFADPSVVTREMVNDVLQYKRIDGVNSALSLLAGNALTAPEAGGLAVQLSNLGQPVRILWGAEDKVIPPPSSDGVYAALDVAVIDGKGHMLHMEAAKDVNAAVLQQLTTV